MGPSRDWNVLRGEYHCLAEVTTPLETLICWAFGLLAHTWYCAVQSYFIFSIGNITPIFQETYKVRADILCPGSSLEVYPMRAQL